MKLSKIFSYYCYDGGMWFRLFGYGLSIENTDKRSLIFSERNGYIKTIKIGNYSIKFLNK